MLEENGKVSMVNKILIAMLVVICVFAVLLILLTQLNKKSVETHIKETQGMIQNYATIEENTWDISANGDGSIIATLSEDGTLTISGTGNMKEWTLNDTSDWHNSKIKSNVKNVIINEGVTNIGSRAFYECINLRNVENPTSVTNIGDWAFMWCGVLTSIDLPKTLTNIGNRAFENCSSLISMTIPSSVRSIGEDAFSKCSSLSEIKVNVNNLEYMDDNGVLYTKDKTKIIQYPQAKEGAKYTVLQEATSIGKSAFSNCSNLTEINIPDLVTSIEDSAFDCCISLAIINIPDGVTSIGSWAFAECKSLTSIKIPNGVSNIGWGAFDECSRLTSINIPEKITSIDYQTFYGCSSLTSVSIPNNVKSIEGWAFAKCSSLTSITIPEGVTTIGNNVFNGCSNLISIKLPKSVANIGLNTFSGCYNLIITCYNGSIAETYAIKNNIKYQLIYLSSTEQEIDELNLLIKGIQPNTTVEELKETIQSEMSYEIINSEGNILTDVDIVATKYELKLENGTLYKLIVCGDTNGDGQADLKDILAINKHRLNKVQLASEYLLAGDINEDEKADLKDILQINKYRLEKISEL